MLPDRRRTQKAGINSSFERECVKLLGRFLLNEYRPLNHIRQSFTLPYEKLVSQVLKCQEILRSKVNSTSALSPTQWRKNPLPAALQLPHSQTPPPSPNHHNNQNRNHHRLPSPPQCPQPQQTTSQIPKWQKLLYVIELYHCVSVSCTFHTKTDAIRLLLSHPLSPNRSQRRRRQHHRSGPRPQAGISMAMGRLRLLCRRKHRRMGRLRGGI